MKSVIVSDLDLTLTRESLMYEMVAHHLERGMVPPQAQEKRLAIRQRYDQGLIGYDRASREALEVWVGYLKKLSYAELVADARDFFVAHGMVFYPYFNRLREICRPSHDFYLVTANFDFVAQAVCEVFSLNGWVATSIGNSGGICDGTIKNSLLSAAAKGDAAQKILSGYDVTRSIGLGDTENDAVMLEKVAYPVCVNASPGLRSLALERGWRLAAPDDILGIIEANRNFLVESRITIEQK